MQIELTDKQANEFLKAVDNPPKANKALKKLLKQIDKKRTEDDYSFKMGVTQASYLFADAMDDIEEYFRKAPIDYDDRKLGWCWFVDKLLAKVR